MKKQIAIAMMCVAVAGCAAERVQRASTVPDGKHRVPVNKDKQVALANKDKKVEVKAPSESRNMDAKGK